MFTVKLQNFLWSAVAVDASVFHIIMLSILRRAFLKPRAKTTLGRPGQGRQGKQVKQGGDIHERRLFNVYKRKFDNLPQLYDLDVEKRLDLSNLSVVRQSNLTSQHLIPTLQHQLEKYMDGYIHKNIPELNKLKIFQPEEIRFDLFPPYHRPSQDSKLLKFANKQKLKYIMSTSTSTNLLSHFTFFLNRSQSPNFQDVGQEVLDLPKRYMISVRKPCMVVLQKKLMSEHPVITIDNDTSIFKDNTILLNQGKIIQNQLTYTTQQFNQLFVQGKSTPRTEQHHSYTIVNNQFCIRAQIDCKLSQRPDYHFQIKTRATAPIRYDIQNYQDYIDYQLRTLLGMTQSFQRQYFDLIRGPFIKFAYQLYIGNMRGALVFNHNTKNFYGCQYIPFQEICNRIFGSLYELKLMLTLSCKLFDQIVETVLRTIPDFTFIKLGFYSCNASRRLIIFAERGTTNYEQQKQAVIGEEIKNQYDYYGGKPIEGEIYKFQVKVVKMVNGTIECGYNKLFPQDELKVLYDIKSMGRADPKDYMNFIHDALKIEGFNLSFNYAGTWFSS